MYGHYQVLLWYESQVWDITVSIWLMLFLLPLVSLSVKLSPTKQKCLINNVVLTQLEVKWVTQWLHRLFRMFVYKMGICVCVCLGDVKRPLSHPGSAEFVVSTNLFCFLFCFFAQNRQCYISVVYCFPTSALTGTHTRVTCNMTSPITWSNYKTN